MTHIMNNWSMHPAMNRLRSPETEIKPKSRGIPQSAGNADSLFADRSSTVSLASAESPDGTTVI